MMDSSSLRGLWARAETGASSLTRPDTSVRQGRWGRAGSCGTEGREQATTGTKTPEPKKPLLELIREHWSDKLELGGGKSGHVAC